MFSKSQKIVLASGNQGKIREIQALFTDYSILPQNDFNISEVEETGSTFVENAILKARNAAFVSQLPAIADDSGLIVDALGGEPGVISARYAGEKANDENNLLKVLDELKDVPTELRTARFICVLVLMRHANDPLPIIAQGAWEGRITFTQEGENGFGYDPIFWVDEYKCTSAQLSAEQKNQLSHRGQALSLLKKMLNNH